MFYPYEFSFLDTFSVYETKDEAGALGRYRGRYYTKEAADKVAKGIGWFNADGRVTPERWMRVQYCFEDPKIRKDTEYYRLVTYTPETFSGLNIGFDPVAMAIEAERKKIRDAALAKLTKEEIQVLGIK